MCWGKVTKMKGKETNEERKWWVIRCGSDRCRLDLTPSFPSFASPKCPDQQPPDISGHEHCAHTTFWLCAPLEQLPRVHETTEGSSLLQRHMKKMLLNWSRWSDLPNKGAICYPRSIEQLSGCKKDFCIIPITVLKLSGALIIRKKTCAAEVSWSPAASSRSLTEGGNTARSQAEWQNYHLSSATSNCVENLPLTVSGATKIFMKHVANSISEVSRCKNVSSAGWDGIR